MTHCLKQSIQKAAYIAIALPIALLLFSSCGDGTDPENADTAPPAEVTNLNGIPGDKQVTLNWINPADEDFDKVEITYSPNNTAIQVDNGEQTTTVTGLTNGTAYTFTIKTVDESGNKSNGVSSRALTPTGADPDDQTPPAEVTNVNGVAGNGQVILTWTDPADNDFTKVVITSTPGNLSIEAGKSAQTAIIQGLTNGTEYTFSLKSVDASGNESAGVISDAFTPVAPAASAVYMTARITPEGLMAVYEALGRKPSAGQKVAVKISTGEGVNSNHLRPDFIRGLVSAVSGDIVECNTAYGGSRASTAMHYQVAEDRGYTDIATVVIMDESNTMDISIPNGKHLNVNRVGARFSDYRFHVVLSHFKGHAMAGFGGALKNMSIGYASTAGKCLIHTAGASSTNPWGGAQNDFLESMAEAAKSIVDNAGSDNFVYINVMNRLSVDCDCSANPAHPTMADTGILASLDPVALDKACLDLVDAASDGADLRNRINNRNGKLTVTRAAEIGLGSLEYELVSID
jgi:uncharacterized Fe-S center protein